MRRCCRSRERRQRAWQLWTPRDLGSDYRVCFCAKDFAGQIITSGPSIDTWKDLLRNGRDVTSVTTKPTLVRNVFNGNPCVRFNNSPMNSTATIPMGSTYSILVLCKDNASSATVQEPFSVSNSFDATSVEFVLDYDGGVGTNRFCYFNSSVQAKTTGDYSTSPILMAIGLNAGVSQARASGVTAATVGSSITTTDAVFRVGGSRPQLKYPLNGDIHCLMVIASPIGSKNYLKAEGWMAWNYSAPYLLGSNNPFRLRPPLVGD